MRIDTHVHIGGDKLGFSMSENLVIAAMEKYEIDYALVSKSDAAEINHEQRLLPKKLQTPQKEALLRT